MIFTATVKKYEVVVTVLIIAVTCAVFAPAVRFDFINFDDPYFIYGNEHVKNGLTLAGFKWAFLSTLDGNWIPLAWFSHMMDVQFYGMRPGMHHLTNILLHALSSGLLFLFLHKITGSVWQCVTVALLFALHPLHVESVAWISERKDVLSAFFLILCLLAYHKYVKLHNAKSYLLALFLYALGLMSKSMLVTTPILLLLIDYYPLCRFSSKSFKSIFFEKIPFFLLSVIAGSITYISHSSANGIVEQYVLWVRIFRSLVCYLIYLYKAFLPLNLAVIYPYNPYPPTNLQVFIAATLLVLITTGAFILRQKCPFFIVGWFWFFISIMPVIGILQIGDHAWADRYFYIPSIGLFVAIVWSISTLFKEERWKILRLSLVVLSLLGSVVLTTIQLQKWRNSITLFTHTIKVTKNNYIAHYNLGLALYYNKRINESINELKKTINIFPFFTTAYFDMGLIYQTKGDYGLAEEMYKKIIPFSDVRDKAYLSLGKLYLEMKDFQKALDEYAKLRQANSPLAETLLAEINSFGRLQNRSH